MVTNKMKGTPLSLSQYAHVRIVKEKTIFEKGYTSGWSKDIFIIDKIIAQNPVLYTLKELTGKSKPGMYYTEELQQVELSNESD